MGWSSPRAAEVFSVYWCLFGVCVGVGILKSLILSAVVFFFSLFFGFLSAILNTSNHLLKLQISFKLIAIKLSFQTAYII